MNRFRLLVLALGGWLANSLALANGGGYAFGVKFSGNVAPFQASGTQHVRLVEERLDVALRRSTAAVVVRYSMMNMTNAPLRVRFGFPVEASDPNADQYDEEPSPAQKRDSLLRAVKQLQDYTVTLDGKAVPSKYEVEPFATGVIPTFAGSEVLRGIAGWMVSDVTFPAGAPATLEIRYTARHGVDASYVSDDVSEGARSFSYRLSTGAVWSGTIAKGTVTLRADGIPADEVRIEKPLDRFKRVGDQWVWEFSNLEPTLAEDIAVHAVPGVDWEWVYDEEARARGVLIYLQRRGAWAEGHQRFKAKASSTLKANKAHTFEAAHLAEEKPDVPWSEGVAGDGIGEWVELRPGRASPLMALEITPGFVGALFKANGRPSKVEILLNGEHRFTAGLEDLPEPQLIPVLAYTKPVSTLRITILEARPGSRYRDTCIARVVLYDRLPAEPARHGAR